MVLPQISVVISVYQRMPSLNEVMCELLKLEFIEEIILVGTHAHDIAQQGLGSNQKVRRISTSEQCGKGESIKLGSRLCSEPIVVLVNTLDQNFVERLPDALSRFYNCDLIIGFPSKVFMRRFSQVIDIILCRFVSFFTGVEGWALDPAFVVLRSNTLYRNERLLPDTSFFFAVLVIIMFRKKAEISQVNWTSSSSGDTTMPSICVRSVIRLVYWGMFFNPKKVGIPSGIICCLFGIVVLAQSLSSGQGISNFGVLIIAIGVVCIFLATCSQIIAEKILEKWYGS